MIDLLFGRLLMGRQDCDDWTDAVWFYQDSARSGEDNIWSVGQFLMAFAPHKASMVLPDPAATGAIVRRAHVAAVKDGIGWSCEARYPSSVWLQVC